MAIINFAMDQKEIPAGAVNVCEVTESWRGHFSNPDTRLWVWESHNGLCLEDRERNGSWDSDFYMTVWNPETQAPQEILFATTRGWSYPSYGSRPDATPEVRAAYDAWKAVRDEQARKAVAEREAKAPGKGKVLRVVRGRKVPQGTEGRCFWYGKSAYGVRVGIETATGERHFTDAKNVEVAR